MPAEHVCLHMPVPIVNEGSDVKNVAILAPVVALHYLYLSQNGLQLVNTMAAFSLGLLPRLSEHSILPPKGEMGDTVAFSRWFCLQIAAT